MRHSARPSYTVVWDLDGTLVDSCTAIADVFIRVVAALGGPALSAPDIEAAYPVGTPELMLAHLLGNPVTPDDVDTYYAELARARLPRYPGVATALRAQRRDTGAVAVCTGASRRAAAIILDAADLGALVDVTVCAEDAPRAKPAPDGLLAVAARLGIDPAGIAYVGDSARDLVAARAAGALAVAAAWGHQHDPAAPRDLTATTPRDVLALLRGDPVGAPRRPDRYAGQYR